MFRLRKTEGAAAKPAAAKKKKTAVKKGAKRASKAPGKPASKLRKRAPAPRIDLGIGPVDIEPAPGTPRSNGLQAAEAAVAKKATDVVWLDVRGLSGLCDEMVIATARSVPHLQAVGDSVEEALRQSGERVLHRDGLRGADPDWLLLDYGDLLVHLFRSDARENYQLEGYYAKAKVLARWKND